MGGAAASVLDQRKLGEGVRTAVGKRLKFRGGQTLWLVGATVASRGLEQQQQTDGVCW